MGVTFYLFCRESCFNFVPNIEIQHNIQKTNAANTSLCLVLMLVDEGLQPVLAICAVMVKTTMT